MGWSRVFLTHLGAFTVVMGALLSGAWAAPGHAEAYPWVPIHDDAKLVRDPVVDLRLRLYLIGQARHTLDLALYEQGDDLTVGLPVLRALREAADRGVHVRVITQWFFQYLYHPLNQSPSYVTNPPTAVPIEYVVFGSPLSVMKHGWHPSDGIHGKVLIVDGTYALVTGRGHAEMNLRWADSSHLLKGPLVKQVQTAFDGLWPLARATGEVIGPTLYRNGPTPEQLTQLRPHHPRANLPSVNARVSELVTWVHQPSTRPPGAPAATNRGRLLHHDFVRQMLALKAQGKSVSDWDQRLEQLKDPVLPALEERLAQAGKGSQIRFSSMYALLHPRVKTAVKAACARGAHAILFTNGDFETPPVSTLGWFASVTDVQDVAQGGVEVYTFKRNDKLPWNFLHLKVMVVDDTVFFGSHNMNLASTVANDELFFEVQDPELAKENLAFFDSLIKTSGERVSLGHMISQRPLGVVGRTIMRPILGFW